MTSAGTTDTARAPIAAMQSGESQPRRRWTGAVSAGLTLLGVLLIATLDLAGFYRTGNHPASVPVVVATLVAFALISAGFAVSLWTDD